MHSQETQVGDPRSDILRIENFISMVVERLRAHPLEIFFVFLRMDSRDMSTPGQMASMIRHPDTVKEINRISKSMTRFPVE
jgi:hypothetical protein